MSELIHNFGIDWKLLVIQAVNFLILLYILKRFAYQPILKVLRERREGIERGIKMTKEAEEKIKHIEELRKHAIDEARRETLAMITKAEEEGKRHREEIIKEANIKVEKIIADGKKAISEERAKMGEEVYQNAQHLVRLGIEKTLGKLSSKERDERFITEALRELKTHL